jgi:hypothetical protein
MADDAVSDVFSEVPAESEASESLFGGSQPPPPNPQVVDAAAVQAHHPFFNSANRFAASRGKGGGASASRRPPVSGRGRGRGIPGVEAVSDAEEPRGPVFTGISPRELEYLQRQSYDGAASSIASDEDENARSRPRKRRALPPPPERDTSAADVQRGERDAMAAAAFGADDGDDDDVCDEVDDDASQSAIESNADVPRMLPIRGEGCPGCTLTRDIVDCVDEYVRQHATVMSETALYRSAALYYHETVVQPRRREGVNVQKWDWKSMRAHYSLHTTDPVLQRAAAVRSLGAVRMIQEQALLRVNEDGSKTLDTKGAELLLKVLAAQDKQLAELDRARMPPPQARGGR